MRSSGEKWAGPIISDIRLCAVVCGTKMTDGGSRICPAKHRADEC